VRYDVQGRVVSELSARGVEALGAASATATDAAWSPWATKYTYDSAGRRISMTDANGFKTLYFYNMDDKLTHTVRQATDAAGTVFGEVVEYRYNDFNELTDTVVYGGRLSATTFNGLTGKIIQDGGKALPSGTIVGTTDSQTLSAKTLTTTIIADFTNAGHNHQSAAGGGSLDAAAIGAGTVATGRLGSGTANATTFLRGDQTWAVPGGGSDPWTYIKLTSPFTTSSSTAVDITGLAFTPVANTYYEVEVVLFTRTATAATGPRPGVAWPTGLTDGVAFIQQTSAAATNVLQNGNFNAAVLAPVGGLPNTTQSYPAFIKAAFLTGATPSGTFRVQLASETGGTNVSAQAGTFIKYRTYV
jgi:YD repeat-containing protein